MVGERDQIVVGGFFYSPGGLDHMEKHGITIPDVNYVLDHNPLFCRNLPRAFRNATHVMIGRTADEHSIEVFISESDEPNLWTVHSAYRSAVAHQKLAEEGRIE